MLLNRVLPAQNYPSSVPAALIWFCCVAVQKTSKKVLLGELDVTMLTDQSLRDELLSHGLDAGPIVGESMMDGGLDLGAGVCVCNSSWSLGWVSWSLVSR